MKIFIVFCTIFLAALLSCVSAYKQPCGGILEGDNGNFQYSPLTANRQGAKNCIWLVHALGASKLRLTFNEFVATGNNPLILYPQSAPGETSSKPITVPNTAVGSTFDLPGSTVLIILPQASSSISFTWDSGTAKCSAPIDSVTVISDYIETPTGNITWSPRKRKEMLWWIFGTGQSLDDLVEWRSKADLSGCDKSNPCTCQSFEAYGISNEGYLVEIEKVCGTSSSGSFQVQSYPLVIAASANTTQQGRSALELQWKPTAHPEPELGSHIYFGTDGLGIKSYSLATSTLTTIVESDEDLEAIAYDSVSKKIYFCRLSPGRIYRANIDGSDIETVGSNISFEILFDLAFDRRTGNLYVVSHQYYDGIFVCSTASDSLNCAALRTGGQYFIGIALDSEQGDMFIAGYYGVYSAKMDGSNFKTLATGVKSAGIALDPASDRLYRTYYLTGQIVSSFRNGSGIETIIQTPSSATPWGLAILNGTLYWGNYDGRSLQRSSTTGRDVATFYYGSSRVQHLTVVQSPDLKKAAARSVSSPCESQGCSHLCVIAAANSLRCMCPEGSKLAGDQKSCLDPNVN